MNGYDHEELGLLRLKRRSHHPPCVLDLDERPARLVAVDDDHVEVRVYRDGRWAWETTLVRPDEWVRERPMRRRKA